MSRGRRGPLHRLPIHATARDIKARLACVGPARDVFRTVAARWGVTSPVLDDLVTVVSELVTNAARHTRPGILDAELRLCPLGKTLRFEITDHSHRMPRPTTAFGDDTAEDGRGLLIVTALADQWGTAPKVTGKTIWAEFVLPAALDAPTLAHRWRTDAITDLVAAGRLRRTIRIPRHAPAFSAA